MKHKQTIPNLGMVYAAAIEDSEIEKNLKGIRTNGRSSRIARKISLYFAQYFC